MFKARSNSISVGNQFVEYTSNQSVATTGVLKTIKIIYFDSKIQTQISGRSNHFLKIYT